MWFFPPIIESWLFGHAGEGLSLRSSGVWPAGAAPAAPGRSSSSRLLYTRSRQSLNVNVMFGLESLWILLRALIKGCKIDVFLLLFIWKRMAPPERGGILINAFQTARENVSTRWSLSFHYLCHGCGAAALLLFPLQLSLNTSPDKNNRNLKTRHTARETAVNKT